MEAGTQGGWAEARKKRGEAKGRSLKGCCQVRLRMVPLACRPPTSIGCPTTEDKRRGERMSLCPPAPPGGEATASRGDTTAQSLRCSSLPPAAASATTVTSGTVPAVSRAALGFRPPHLPARSRDASPASLCPCVPRQHEEVPPRSHWGPPDSPLQQGNGEHPGLPQNAPWGNHEGSRGGPASAQTP